MSGSTKRKLTNQPDGEGYCCEDHHVGDADAEADVESDHHEGHSCSATPNAAAVGVTRSHDAATDMVDGDDVKQEEVSRVAVGGLPAASEVLATVSRQAAKLYAAAVTAHCPSFPYHENGNMETTMWLKRCPPTADQLRTARVYYNSQYLDAELIPTLLTDVPQVAVTAIQYQNGQFLTRFIGDDDRAVPGLITDVQRRLSRRKVISAACRVRCFGGYPEPELTNYGEAWTAIILSLAGAQFGFMGRLESRDFLIHKASNPPTLFTSCFPHNNGVKPTWNDLSRLRYTGLPDAWFVRLTSDTVLDRAAFLEAMTEDMMLIMKAFDDSVARVGGGKLGYLKATAIGMGWFATYKPYGSMVKFLLPLLLKAWQRVLCGTIKFPHVHTVEFPDFSGHYKPDFGPTTSSGVHVVHTMYRDVLDFSEQQRSTFVCGALNAGDCYCIPGNEYGYESVEAMLGNNTDLRVVQSYVHNPALLDAANYVSIVCRVE